VLNGKGCSFAAVLIGRGKYREYLKITTHISKAVFCPHSFIGMIWVIWVFGYCIAVRVGYGELFQDF
jgi:hypothetical protein